MGKPVKNTVIPWTDIMHKSSWYTTYQDLDKTVDPPQVKRYIFLPNELHGPGLSTAIVNAYNLATMQNQVENWQGFNLIIKVGEAAGQELNRPYIELIPIRNKDVI